MIKTICNISLVGVLLSAPALAEETTGLESKNAQKVVAVLDSVGINDPEVKAFVSEIDARTEKGQLKLAEQETDIGTFSLNYDLKLGLAAKQAELQFSPHDSNWKSSIRTNQALVSYQYKF